MALYEEDLMEDLADEEAEGAADAYDEAFDEYEEFDEFDEGEEFDEGDEFEEYDEGDEFEEYEEDYEDNPASFETAVAAALSAEDSDEFLRRIRNVARRVGSAVRRAAPVIGRVARAAAPILRVIPHPAAQVAARAAGVLGRLRMEGASEEEALEAMAEVAARNPRAVPTPVMAGLAARALVRRAGAAMPPAARRAAIRRIVMMIRLLIRRLGPRGYRILPRIIRSVRRTAAVRQTPPSARPGVALNTARRVAANPRMAQQLARPSPRAQAIVRRAAGPGAVRPAAARVRA